ncbi:hypothetical protein [Brevibacillus reuszeri]|uniref:hypothetical protein n=1 Tax=Brevibacillus reuszeri TaxID=54915 RepID=UPI003D1D5541
MPVPATTGQLKSRILNMEIGDYIVGNYDDVKPEGSKYGIGQGSYTECPVTGIIPTNFKSHFFYYVKVGKGIIVSDRIVMNSISWDAVNSNKMMQGRPNTMDGIVGVIRSLTGGVAFADANGDKATSDKGYGRWPTNNEWDRYIVNFPKDKIQIGKTSKDIFNTELKVVTWCQDTPINGMSKPSGGIPNPSSNIGRTYGYEGSLDWAESTWGTVYNGTSQGFRPVFEYKE